MMDSIFNFSPHPIRAISHTTKYNSQKKSFGNQNKLKKQTLQIKIKGVTLVVPLILHSVLTTMSTTSIKLPDDIKQKANAAALDLGITPHAFMVEAIRKATLAAEKQAAFIADAQAARTATLQSGLGFSATDVHEHLHKRISEKIDAGKKKKVPKSRKLTAKPWRA